MTEPKTGVYVIVDTPNHNFTQHPEQPASTMTAYYVERQDPKEKLDDVVKRAALSYPPTSTITAFEAADGTRFNFKTTLEAS